MNLLDIPILKRLYPSIIKRYFMLISKYQVNIKINNLNFEIDIRENIERKIHTLLVNTKKRVDQLHLFSKIINSEIFIDICSHIGFYSILSSHRFEQ